MHSFACASPGTQYQSCPTFICYITALYCEYVKTQIHFPSACSCMKYCQLGLCVILQWACRGAAEGEGLGNAFLSHIQAVDGIFHVCRGFEDPEVTHVEDRVDPVEDLEIIHKYVIPSADEPYTMCKVPFASAFQACTQHELPYHLHLPSTFRLHTRSVAYSCDVFFMGVFAWHDQRLIWHLRAAVSCV